MLKKNTKNQFTESKDHKSNKNLNLNFIEFELILNWKEIFERYISEQIKK